MDLQAWVTRGKEKFRTMGLKQWGMLLIAGVCCLIIVFPVGEEKQDESIGKEYQTEAETNSQSGEETDYVKQMEERLTGLLSSVEDVGKVRVMITVSSTTEKNVLQDGSNERSQSTEMDSAGGSRNTVSERREGTTVFYESSGENTPYILSETYPEITGVVVIAEGSGIGSVDLDILGAVQVLFDVPAHKIKIMKMK